MSSTQLVSVDEYLHSTYEPDAEYVEGRVVLRAFPLRPCSKIKGYLAYVLYEIAHALGFKVWISKRVRTAA